MESLKISSTVFIKTLRDKNIAFFTSYDIAKLFKIKRENSLSHLLCRLKKNGIVKLLTRNKYFFLQGNINPSDFAIANFLVPSSYISLESALSFYGIINQFPYQIVSLTPFKTRIVQVNPKQYVFSHIKKEYYKDFVKVNDFLIATPEKALFDYLYFIFKGLRPKNIITDLKRTVGEKKCRQYFFNNADLGFRAFLRKTL